VRTNLISRARAGDGDAFRELTEPHRRELLVHCYRMLGSFQDALQETLLAAWEGLGGFEGRASMRTWLYRIATNRCLNALRTASRRPAKEWDIPRLNRPSRPSSAKSCGSSHIPMPSWRVPWRCRLARRPATNRAKPSPWPS
jgi:DNA-directed RNA polymerase specialized sigma24 family protein